MKRALTSIATLTVMMLGGQQARSQDRGPDFGASGHVALSGERLFGYVHAKQTEEVGNVDISDSSDSFSLLSSPLGGLGSGYTWPRIGADVFVARSFSVGLAASFFTYSQNDNTLSGFAFAPRVGYAALLTSRLALWPRLGVTYQQFSDNPAVGPTLTQSAFALTLEAPLTILLAPRVAILVGPSLDYGLTGSRSVGGVSANRTFTDFSIWAGLLVFI